MAVGMLSCGDSAQWDPCIAGEFLDREFQFKDTCFRGDPASDNRAYILFVFSSFDGIASE